MNIYYSIIRNIVIFVGITLIVPTAVLARTANDPNGEQWAYEKIKAYEAWDTTIGSRDVVVAIVDNGFDYLQTDLRDNVWKNTDEIPNNKKDDDKNGYIDDVYGWNFIVKDSNNDGVISAIEQFGNNDPRPDATDTEIGDSKLTIHHGTLVAGIIGAVGNNNTFGSGISWRVRLMNIKLATNNGTGALSSLDKAILYAVNNGAHIINLSLVGDFIPDGLMNALNYAASRGVLVVAAAGNDNLDLSALPMYPICADADSERQLVLGVTAVRSDRRLASFSNAGGGCIDLAAPGVSISSTLRFSPKNGFDVGYSGQWNGTSFATPMVSGAAALVKSANPYWQASDIYQTLTTYTSKTPGQNEDIYKQLFGGGLLDVSAAVLVAKKDYDERIGSSTLKLVDAQGLVFSQQENKFIRDAKIELSNIDDLAVFSGTTGTMYATTKFVDGINTVVLYNSGWKRLRSWKKVFPGPQNIALVDIDFDTQPEIFLTPTNAIDNKVLRVYNFKGKIKKEIKHSLKVSGPVSLSVERYEDVYTTVLAFKDSDGFAIHTFDESFSEINNIPVDDFNEGAELLLVRNLSQDLEYLFVKPSSGTMALYNSVGTLKKTALIPSVTANKATVALFDGSVLISSQSAGNIRSYDPSTLRPIKKENIPVIPTSVSWPFHLAVSHK